MLEETPLKVQKKEVCAGGYWSAVMHEVGSRNSVQGNSIDLEPVLNESPGLKQESGVVT